MRPIFRISLFILFVLITYMVLITPYGTAGNSKEALLDMLEPLEVNAGIDPLFGFCIYAPLLLFVESFFFQLPFKRWQVVLLILQFIGIVSTLPFAFFVPLGIPFGRVEPNAFAAVVILWAIYVATWHLLLLIPSSRKWKWVSWPFRNTEQNLSSPQ